MKAAPLTIALAGTLAGACGEDAPASLQIEVLADPVAARVELFVSSRGALEVAALAPPQVGMAVVGRAYPRDPDPPGAPRFLAPVDARGRARLELAPPTGGLVDPAQRVTLIALGLAPDDRVTSVAVAEGLDLARLDPARAPVRLILPLVPVVEATLAGGARAAAQRWGGGDGPGCAGARTDAGAVFVVRERDPDCDGWANAVDCAPARFEDAAAPPPEPTGMTTGAAITGDGACRFVEQTCANGVGPVTEATEDYCLPDAVCAACGATDGLASCLRQLRPPAMAISRLACTYPVNTEGRLFATADSTVVLRNLFGANAPCSDVKFGIIEVLDELPVMESSLHMLPLTREDEFVVSNVRPAQEGCTFDLVRGGIGSLTPLDAQPPRVMAVRRGDTNDELLIPVTLEPRLVTDAAPLSCDLALAPSLIGGGGDRLSVCAPWP